MLKPTERKTGELSRGQFDKIIKSVPIAKKVGIMCDGENHFVVLFKRETSSKPYAYVPLEHVLYLIDDYSETSIEKYSRYEGGDNEWAN